MSKSATRVLVVEDEALVAMTMCDDLAELGCRIVGPYGRTIRCCMQTVCRYMRTVRLGSLGFAQYVAARAHVSVIH